MWQSLQAFSNKTFTSAGTSYFVSMAYVLSFERFFSVGTNWMAINTTINPKMKNYPTAIQINRNIYSYLQNSKSYHKLTNCFESPKEGKVILFEKNEY